MPAKGWQEPYRATHTSWVQKAGSAHVSPQRGHSGLDHRRGILLGSRCAGPPGFPKCHGIILDVR